MEFMSNGCLTEILDQYATVQLREVEIAFVSLCVSIFFGGKFFF